MNKIQLYGTYLNGKLGEKCEMCNQPLTEVYFKHETKTRCFRPECISDVVDYFEQKTLNNTKHSSPCKNYNNSVRHIKIGDYYIPICNTCNGTRQGNKKFNGHELCSCLY